MPRTMAGPRKRRQAETEPESAQSPPAKRPYNGDRAWFPFLQLPRELRDEIYKQIVASDQPTTLKSRNLVIKSGLVGVNSQICKEFLDAVLYYAPIINTTVRNHNFAHVVTFLNRLSEAQLTRFTQDPTTSQQQSIQASRKLRITLIYSATKQSSRPQLSRWLDRFGDTSRRGAEIDFEYFFDGTTWKYGGSKQRPRFRSSASERSNEEVRKMLQAINRGLRSRYRYHGSSAFGMI